MKKFLIIVTLLGLLMPVLGGCATTKGYGRMASYRLSEQLKGVGDDEALGMGCTVYNVTAKTKAEEAARNITLDEFVKEMSRRKTKKIKESGALEIEYEEVKLNKWTEEELASFYKYMKNKTSDFDVEPDLALTETEKGRRIIHATAVHKALEEAKRRDNIKLGMDLMGKALSVVLGLALALI